MTSRTNEKSSSDVPSEYREMVETLRYRAKRLKLIATFVMVIITGLLGLGALSFLYARQISDLQIPTDYQGELNTLIQRRVADTEKMNEITSRINSNATMLAAGLSAFNRAKDNFAEYQNAKNKLSLPYNKLFSADEWRQALAAVPRHAGEETTVAQQNIGDLLRAEDFDAIVSAIQSFKFTPISNEDYEFLASFNVGAQAESEAEKQLSDIINARKVQAITGILPTLSSVTDADQLLTLPRVIQLNLTRFGPIILITFLVSILTPLYRYNLRLAAFYDGRADALMLLSTSLKSNGFISLAGALSPSLDFGKAPQTPIEQLIELARLYAGKNSEKNDHMPNS